MATVEYDPAVIEKMAGRLIVHADRIRVCYIVLGVVAGVIGGGYAADAIGIDTDLGVLICIFIGILPGYVLAQERSFALKLQAQRRLSQAKLDHCKLQTYQALLDHLQITVAATRPPHESGSPAAEAEARRG